MRPTHVIESILGTLSPLVYEAREASALWRTAPDLAESVQRDAVVISGRAPWQRADDD
jgi:hypothetical protein